MNNQLAKKYIAVIRRACDLLEQQTDEAVCLAFEELAESAVPKPQPGAPDVKEAQMARGKLLDSLLAMEGWPLAIPQFQASVPSEADQIHRANAVLDMSLGTSIEGASFLDYGCGEGYIASEIAHRGPATILGYDPVPSDHWGKLCTEKVRFTADSSCLKPQSYDLVFLYDVLDHAFDPEGIMAHIKSLAVPGAIIYVRCHPWTSKHASHLPKTGLNKSYIHMFITFDELVARGFQPLFTRVEKNPLEAYRWWFKHFRIVKEKPMHEEVHDFFLQPDMTALLAAEQHLEAHEIDHYLERLTLQFVDFVLEA